jgi:beta-glucosidase
MIDTTGLSRRALLGVTSAALGLATTNPAQAAVSVAADGPFRTNFLWGTATGGHQIEGSNVASDMWVMEHVHPTIFPESSGDACDSLNRWEEDLDLIQTLGLNAYRFSVEWSRIEPEPGEFSMAYLDYYARLLDGCLKRGIAPVVTFSHFSTPRWFAEQGNFQSRDGAALFGRYCDKVVRRMGHGMAYAVTLNEPNAAAQIRWAKLPASFYPTMKAMVAAAGKATGSPIFASSLFDAPVTADHLIAAHIEAHAAIKATRSDLPVGIGLSLDDDQAQGAASMRDAKRQDVYAPWFAVTRTHADFIGVQNYGRRIFDNKGEITLPGVALGGRENLPDSLGNAVRYAYAQTGKPVLVTENGMVTSDDALRTAFIPRAVEGLAKAAKAGVPVLGYLHWSLLDNFEWFHGYREKYGLVAVDWTTFRRTPKPSAHELSRIARSNGRLISSLGNAS